MNIWKKTTRGFCLAIGILLLLSLHPPRIHATSFFLSTVLEKVSSWLRPRTSEPQADPCIFRGTPLSWRPHGNEVGIIIDGPNCDTRIIPRGFDVSPNPSYTYEFDWQPQENVQNSRTFIFKWQNQENWYGLKLFPDEVHIEKMISGTSYTLSQSRSQFSFLANHSYHIQIVVLYTSKFQVYVDGIPIISAQDQEPFFPGIYTVGLQTHKLPFAEIKDVTVRSLIHGAIMLVDVIKQIDTRWSTQEYDHAHLWTKNPTIGRWGCALSSSVMILRYYGIKTLPDGQELNPGTMNTWLLSQVDGYIDGGLLNWIAITRFAKIMNQKNQTTKLEYAAHKGDISLAQNEIELGKPVILGINGHFLVGTGVSSDKTVTYINDPYYSYTEFGQHQKKLLSVRTFTPSHTDLSYFLATHDHDVTLDLKDDTGKKIEQVQEESEHITDAFDEVETTPARVQTLLAKPSDGHYTLEVSRTIPGPYDITLYTYDKFADPIIQHFSGEVGTTPKKLSFSYHKSVTFSVLEDDIVTLKKSGQIKTPVFLKLLRLVRLGARAA